jgi:hypothetical protein
MRRQWLEEARGALAGGEGRVMRCLFFHIIPVMVAPANDKILSKEAPLEGEAASSHDSVQIAVSEIAPHEKRKLFSVKLVINRVGWIGSGRV